LTPIYNSTSFSFCQEVFRIFLEKFLRAVYFARARAILLAKKHKTQGG